jgi:surfactin synthase thioesterase subunit
LGGWAEIALGCLPGRDARLSEQAFDDLPALTHALADGILPWLSRDQRGYVVFGHSMGALVGFELVRELRRRGERLPDVLVVSGRPAPQLPYAADRRRLDELDEDELIAHLRRRGGTPEELLSDREALRIFEPTLRRDLALVEDYVYRPEPPLPLPLLGYRGRSDPDVRAATVDAWRAQTESGFRRRDFAGGHFYHLGNDVVAGALRRDLVSVARVGDLTRPGASPGTERGARRVGDR